MTRKTLFHPQPTTRRTGLVVADFQTLHWGHVNLLSQMAASCDDAIVAIGSVQVFNVGGHPFSYEQKVEMVQTIFPNRFQFLGLHDIDASLETSDWLDYVLSRIDARKLPDPTDYFTGSDIDARYYTNHFAALSDPAHLEGRVRVHQNAAFDRRLHIVDRSNMPSGRDIRALIQQRDPQWRQYVPAKLWTFIEQNYPPQLRIAINGRADPAQYPVGTRCIENGGVLVLHDDRKWRPLKEVLDDKTKDYHARRS